MAESVEKILIISLPGIGNTLLFTPALRVLRRKHPEARIDVLVEGAGSVQILETNPDIDKVMNLRAADHGIFSLKTVWELRSEKYDLSYTTFPSNRPRYNVFTWLVGARRRVIHSYPDSRVPALTFLQTDRVPARQGLHDILQNMRMVSEERAQEIRGGVLPRPLMYLTEEDREFADDYWAELPSGTPVVGIHPGSSAGKFHQQGAKRWPAEKFARTAELLVKESDATVLFFCGPDERDLEKTLQRLTSGDHAARMHFPKGRLRQVAALIEKTDAMISNDSGLMHIATALNTPVVALFGPTNPDRTGPPWDDCTIIKAKIECGNSLNYPFTTTNSTIHCQDYECWESLNAPQILRVMAHSWKAPRKRSTCDKATVPE